jgi:hypothetical protein
MTRMKLEGEGHNAPDYLYEAVTGFRTGKRHKATRTKSKRFDEKAD